MPKDLLFKFTGVLILFVVCSVGARAQGTTFTYQGRLTDGVSTANGTYQMTFTLFDALVAGSQIGTPIVNNNVTVVNGIFAVDLDFGSAVFPGAGRFLQISVKKPAEASFTAMTPRQSVTTSPYAIRTLSAAVADNVSGIVSVANGGTGASSASTARSNLGLGGLSTLNAVSTTEITDGTITNADISPTAAIAGSKISGNISGNAANVTGTIAVANGGTGSTTSTGALNNLLPSQTGNGGKVLQTDGANATWQTPAAGGGGILFTQSTANQTINVTSPSYINSLSVSLAAGQTYFVRLKYLQSRVNAATTLTTTRWHFTGTGTTPSGIDWAGFFVAGTTFNSSGSFDTETNGVGQGASTAPGYRICEFVITTTTAGVLTFQAARGTTNTANDWTVLAGSTLTATPLN